MRERKFTYYYVLQGNYGYGWEDLVSYERKNSGYDPNAYKEAKSDLRDYVMNERNALFRIIHRAESV